MVIFIGITNLFGIQILVPLGKEKLVVYSVIVGAVVNATLNWWLILVYSYVGTAYANLAAELAVLLVQMYFIRDMLPDIVKGTNYISMAISLILASFASLLSVKFFEGDSNIINFILCSLLYSTKTVQKRICIGNRKYGKEENREVELNIYIRTPVN